MVFSSIYFLWWFLPIVLVILLLIDKKYQNIFLFLASIFFYAWGEPEAVLVLLVSIIINFFLVRLMDKSTRLRKAFLIGIICLNIGILFHYKYAEFVLNEVLKMNVDIGNRLLPIGISFYTFQILSYAIEVYWGNAGSLTNFFEMGLYVSFFPKVSQGPIEKYTDFVGQLHNRLITYDKMYDGIKRFIIGLGKKVLVANVLGEVTDAIFAVTADQLSTSVAWLGALSYTVQIYYDFSGYSDMAIGLGKMMGFEFKENFNYPYMATSVKDFWRKWHISLSSWFRDYIYIPLGGNRKGNFRTCANLMIVFVVTGIWHGANWTFWLWGIWHGIMQIGEKCLWGKYLKKIKWVNILYTDLIVLLGWVLFRADSVEYAFAYIKNMFVYRSALPNYTIADYMDSKVFVVLIFGVVFAGLAQNCMEKYREKLKNSLVVEIGKVLLLLVVFLLCLMSIASGAYNPFIYFKF